MKITRKSFPNKDIQKRLLSEELQVVALRIRMVRLQPRIRNHQNSKHAVDALASDALHRAPMANGGLPRVVMT